MKRIVLTFAVCGAALSLQACAGAGGNLERQRLADPRIQQELDGLNRALAAGQITNAEYADRRTELLDN